MLALYVFTTLAAATPAPSWCPVKPTLLAAMVGGCR
jgi:hypothetical protein